MDKAYIYESAKNNQLSGSEAIVMLPDIYCQTDYSKRTVEELATAFNKPVFMLDYFFLSTNQVNNFNENDRESVRKLMQDFKGDEFVTFFRKVLEEIKQAYSHITQFTLIGFCFGGRLAYIAGGEKDVSRIISFYGAGSNTPNYVSGQTPIEYLVSKRKEDVPQVTSFFGINDTSILEADRQKIKEELKQGGVIYDSYEYNAGHAYFQDGRPNYSIPASQASWEVLRQIFQ
jgi:dienelactone hydrolase